MNDSFEKAADIILNSDLTLALTGAGISVESGIPDFRSAQGLWSRYDPGEYATIEAFRDNPHKVWKMLREMDELVSRAKPNPAHRALSQLENLGCLQTIVTQNVDNLHQAAGSNDVIEFHGNASTLSCLWCGRKYQTSEKRKEHPPHCECEKILKPDVVFFGEAIPEEAMHRSFRLASQTDALLVVGTSAVVYPVNEIPSLAKRNGAAVIEVDIETTVLTNSITDIFLQGNAGDIVPALVEIVKQKKGTDA